MKKLFLIAMGLLLLNLTFVLALPEKTGAFVCPVLNANVGAHNPNAVPIANGDYTIIGPNVNVPVHATNRDGAGSPGGDHSTPGDPGYSPIWNL